MGSRGRAKKQYSEFLELAREFNKEVHLIRAAVKRREKLFDLDMRRKVESALAVKKEYGLLTTPVVELFFNNVEPDLWEEFERKIRNENVATCESPSKEEKD